MQKISWPKIIIEKISSIVKTGTKFFLNHGKETNDHDNRKPLGEVLVSTLKNIGGKLSNIVIGHFPDENSVKNLDVISMEADINTDNNNNVKDVFGITGIAMASSNNESPAFPGAVRLAAIQCFADTLEKGENKMEITFTDVQKFVKDNNVFPHQLYDEDVMKSDRKFGKIYEEFNSLKVDNERITKEKEVLEESSKEAIKKTQIFEANELLKTITKEGFTDKQKEFINSRFDPSKIEDLSEQGLKIFVENGKKEFSEMAKLFSGTEQATTESEQSGGTGDESGDPVEKILKTYED